ncbi:MAG: S-layer homology domain-containing protein [Patescibacteria group bacterium]|nr:S-layer homology domain-containing protein [Patescibacteria group bacterium]
MKSNVSRNFKLYPIGINFPFGDDVLNRLKGLKFYIIKLTKMQLRKFFAAIVMIAVAVSLAPMAKATAFTDQGDIPSWATSAVDQLVTDGVISGYADGRFGPNDSLTREQFAKIADLASQTSVPASVTEAPFPDVPASRWSAPYVKAAKDAGIIGGYQNGNFGPSDVVTRGQAAKMLVNAFGLEKHTEKGPNFDDVNSSMWEYEFVETAYYWSVIDGYQNGNFGKDDAVTRAQIAKMTVKAQTPVMRAEFSNGGTEIPVDKLGLATVEAKTSTTVDVVYNMAVEKASAETIANYTITGSTLEVTSAILGTDEKTVTLSTAQQVSGHDYTVTIANVKSKDGSKTIDESYKSLGFLGFVTAVSSNTFTVSVSPSSPVAASIPSNANGVPFLAIDLTAGSVEDVKISRITIERAGLGSDSDFTSIYLYDGDTRLTNGRNFTSDTHTAAFNLYNAITVGAGTTKTLTVVGTMAGVANKINYLRVAFPEDIVATGVTSGGAVTVSGNFPIKGAEMTTVNVSAGTLTVDTNGTVNSEAKVGDLQAEFGLFKLTSANEDILVTSITVENKGSGPEDIANLKLYDEVAGTVLASVASVGTSANSDQVVFNLTGLTDGGLYLNKGASARLAIKADVIGANSTADKIDFKIDNTSDVTGIGQTYGYGVGVTDNTTTNGLSNISGGVTIKSTDLVFSWIKPDQTKAAADTTSVIVGKLSVVNRSEDTLIKTMKFDMAFKDAANANIDALTSPGTYIDNITLLDPAGLVVAGPATPAGATGGGAYYVTFNDDWLLPSTSTAQTYTLKADLKNTLSNGDYFQFTMKTTTSAYFDAEGNVTGNTIDTTTNVTPSKATTAGIVSDKITVQQSTLTLSLANTPASQTLVAGNEIEILGFTMTTNDSGKIKVTKIPVVFQSDENANGTYAATGESISEVGTSVKLYKDDGTLLSEKSLQDTVNFDSFLTNLEVASGNQVKLIIKMVTSNSATNGGKVAAEVTIGNITAQDAQGNALAAAQLLPASGVVNDISATPTVAMTLVTGGGLVVKADTNTPIANQAAFGATGIELLKVNLSASNEVVYVTKMNFSMEADNLDSQIKKLYLYECTTPTTCTTLVDVGRDINTNSANAGYVEWSWTGANRISVPKDGDRLLSVKADMNVTNGNASVLDDIAGKFRIKVAQIEAEGSKADVIAKMKSTTETSETAQLDLEEDLDTSETEIDYDTTSHADEGLLLPGTIIKIGNGTDGAANGVEYMQVVSNNTSTDKITVIRGINGSTATTHTEANLATDINVYNIVSNYFIPYDTLATVTVASDPIYGMKGAPGPSMKVFGFTIGAAANAGDTRTQKVVLNGVKLNVTGNVDVKNAALYDGSDDSLVAVAASSGDHDSASASSYIVFNLAGAADSDREVEEGTTKSYYVKADVNFVQTGAENGSLAISIASLGSIGATGTYTYGDLIWSPKNGNTVNNMVAVVKQSPSDVTPASMNFNVGNGAGTASADATIKLMAVDAQGTTTLVFYFSETAYGGVAQSHNGNIAATDFAFVDASGGGVTISAVSHTAGNSYGTITLSGAWGAGDTLAAAAYYDVTATYAGIVHTPDATVADSQTNATNALAARIITVE